MVNDALVRFLGSLVLNPELAQTKTIEMDLKGNLNPSIWLNYLFFEKNCWLNFKDFYDYYWKNNQFALEKQVPNLSPAQLKKGLEARLYRTQFGMLTEYHAFFLCREVFGQENVLRHPDLDRIGVDFQIFFEQKCHHIHIFVDTKRAWHFRQIKAQYKNSNQLTGIHINVPYSLEANRFNSLHFLPNGFGIYQKSYFEYLKNELLAQKITNDNIIATTQNGFIYKND